MNSNTFLTFAFMCFVSISEETYTTLRDWFVQPKRRMFTARYALNTYIKHISFVLIRSTQNWVQRVNMKQLTSSALWRVIPVTAGLAGLNAAERTVSSVEKQQCSSVLFCGFYERVKF